MRGQVSQWQSKIRCRQRVMPLSRAVHPKGKWSQKEVPADQLLGKLIRLEKGSYQTSITDLRMVTNYTFTVDADYHGFPYNLATGSQPYSPTSSEQFPVSAETKGCKLSLPSRACVLFMQRRPPHSSCCHWTAHLAH